MKEGNTNSPWFPNVFKKGSTTSSPWFPNVYGTTDNIVKKSMGKPKYFGGKNDLDGDGIPNWNDCQPKNVMRQDRVMNIATEGMGRLISNIHTINPTPPISPTPPQQMERLI